MSEQYDWDHSAMLPGGLYDVAANETWLEEQAKKGYRAYRAMGTRIYFAKEKNADIRYRLQPMMSGKEAVGQDRIELYGSLGWEYVDAVGNVFHLWSCENSDAPELDTDPIVQADGYRYLKKCMLRSVAAESGILLLVVLLGLGGGTVLRNLLRNALPFENLFWLATVISVAILEAINVRTMLRFLKRLNAGEDALRPRPYRGKQWLQRVAVICWVGFLVLQAAGLFWPAGNRDMIGWSAMANDRTPQAGVVYLDMEHMAEQGQEMRFECALRKFYELAPTVTQVRQRAVEGGIGVTADTTHYVLLSSRFTDTLVKDIRYAYRNWEPFEEIEAAGLDRFLISTDDGPQVVIAVKGREVLEIVYGGKTDLQTQSDYIASLFQ